MSPGMTSGCRLAAVRFSDGGDIDRLLETVARDLRADGVNVGGFLQREFPGEEGCCSIISLENLANGALERISQPLGIGSRGCRLDPRALAGLTGPLVRQLDSGIDLLILNRFGKGESEGQGFRQAIERAFDIGTPVLTAVRETYAEAWDDFGGGFATSLPAEPAPVLAWCRSVLSAGGQPAGPEDRHAAVLNE